MEDWIYDNKITNNTREIMGNQYRGINNDSKSNKKLMKRLKYFKNKNNLTMVINKKNKTGNTI